MTVKAGRFLQLAIEVDADIPDSEVEYLLTDYLMDALEQHDCDWELRHIRKMVTVGLEAPAGV